jgi:crotonobetainyl-CoA:carnitine CoA-transferase CaiB-like acyl-CoA transferase
MNELPLTGVTVLDFGQVYNGPYCGFLLAQAGARVIKVESPRGESLRGRGDRNSGSYALAMLNTNKECISLNIKSEEGQALLKALARHVDVVMENFAPGTMARYGVGSAELTAENPRLVYAASTGYGGSGPHSGYLGMDITIQATSGVMSITGEGDGPPLKAGPAFCDMLGGVHLFGAITAALYRRAQTGEGAVIDISMQDCVFPSLTTALGAYFLAGEQPPRTGNRHAGMSLAPYNVYRAQDGWVAMICIREGHWRNLVAAMDRPELLERPEFADMAARAANMDTVDETVEAWTSTLPKAEVVARAQSRGVICAPVLTLEEVVNDPHLHERGTLHWHDHPTLGRIVLLNSPLRFAGTTLPEVAEVPYVGAHNGSVYSELLGLSEDDVAALRERDAI